MEKTLAVIKPNVMESHNYREVLRFIEDFGFKIIDRKLSIPTVDFVMEFYKEHSKKPHFTRLVGGMSNRKWLFLSLSHPDGNTIQKWRQSMVFLRYKFSGTELHDNAVHGSDSEESAKKEIDLVFGYFLDKCVSSVKLVDNEDD